MSRCEAVSDDGRRCIHTEGHDAPDEFGGVEMHSDGEVGWGELFADGWEKRDPSKGRFAKTRAEGGPMRGVRRER